jgi:hypothetical protein
MLAGNSAYVPPAFESIASVTGTGSASTLTLSSIPTGYTHLQVRGIVNDGSGYQVRLRFNGDSANNYTYNRLIADTAAFYTAGATNVSGIEVVGVISGAASTYPTNVIIDIDNYLSSYFKSVKSFYGTRNVGAGYVGSEAGTWRSTSAINSITFVNTGSVAFSTTTRFDLYGIKAAQ